MFVTTQNRGKTGSAFAFCVSTNETVSTFEFRRSQPSCRIFSKLPDTGVNWH
jgi:hypothetical protein